MEVREPNGAKKGAEPVGREARRAANRARILEAATELFFTRGFARTKVDDVCAVLGVTKPFVYWYFKDKQAILDALAIEAASAIVRSFEGASELPPEEALRTGLRSLVRANVQGFKAGSFYYREPGALSPETRHRIARMAADFHDTMVGVMESAVKANVLPPQDVHVTALAVAGIVGFMFAWYRPEGRLAPSDVEARLLEACLRTVGFREVKIIRPRLIR